jgi:hypothetical protein
LSATIGTARIPLQVDVGFGDAVTPQAETVELPTLLYFPAPTIRAYPPETVIAEKYQAMIVLGIGNTRMKNVYDIHPLSTGMSSTVQRVDRKELSTGLGVHTCSPLSACSGVVPNLVLTVRQLQPT